MGKNIGYFYRNRGVTLPEILIALSAMAIVSFGVVKLMTNLNQGGDKVIESSVMNGLSNEMVAIGKNPAVWLNVVRAPSMSSLMGPVASCIPSSGTPSCPAPQVFADPKIQALAGVSTSVVSTNLVNIVPQGGGVLGTQIAGTTAAPLCFDNTGKILTANAIAQNPKCRFLATGYMIMQRASGDPGSVDFLLKVEANALARQKNELVIAPLYSRVSLGTSWHIAGCASPQVQGTDPSGQLLCYDAPPTCPAGTSFGGWATNGHALPCQPFPNCPPGQSISSLSPFACAQPNNPVICKGKPKATCGPGTFAASYPGFPITSGPPVGGTCLVKNQHCLTLTYIGCTEGVNAMGGPTPPYVACNPGEDGVCTIGQFKYDTGASCISQCLAFNGPNGTCSSRVTCDKFDSANGTITTSTGITCTNKACNQPTTVYNTIGGVLTNTTYFMDNAPMKLN